MHRLVQALRPHGCRLVLYALLLPAVAAKLGAGVAASNSPGLTVAYPGDRPAGLARDDITSAHMQASGSIKRTLFALCVAARAPRRSRVSARASRGPGRWSTTCARRRPQCRVARRAEPGGRCSVLNAAPDPDARRASRFVLSSGCRVTRLPWRTRSPAASPLAGVLRQSSRRTGAKMAAIRPVAVATDVHVDRGPQLFAAADM